MRVPGITTIFVFFFASLLWGCGSSHDAQVTAELDRADSLLRTSDTAAHSAALRQMVALDTARALQADEVRYTYAADGRKLHVDYVLNPFAIADEGGEGEAPDPSGPDGPAGMAGALPGSAGLQAFDGDPIEIEEPDEPLEPQVLMTRDWCGGHLYRNGALERIENEYGYWADSCYHYRIADYQGNVRAVISQNGVLERSSKS